MNRPFGERLPIGHTNTVDVAIGRQGKDLFVTAPSNGSGGDLNDG